MKQHEMMHEFYVECISRFAQKYWIGAQRALKIRLDVKTILLAQLSLPAQIDVSPGRLVVERFCSHNMTGVAAIHVAFRKAGVATRIVISAKAKPFLVPRIVVDAVSVMLMSAFEAASEEPEAELLTRPSSVLKIVDRMNLIASESTSRDALRVTCPLRDDIDDAITRVRSPDRSARTANDIRVAPGFQGSDLDKFTMDDSGACWMSQRPRIRRRILRTQG